MTTTRGLEYCTATSFDIASSNKGVVRMLLDEQDRQRREGGVIDPLGLAALISQNSRHQSGIAHLAEMMDARAVYGNDKQWNATTTTTGVFSRFNSSSSQRESRRGRRVQRSGSLGAMDDRVRRRRGSRHDRGTDHPRRKAASDTTSNASS